MDFFQCVCIYTFVCAVTGADGVTVTAIWFCAPDEFDGKLHVFLKLYSKNSAAAIKWVVEPCYGFLIENNIAAIGAVSVRKLD